MSVRVPEGTKAKLDRIGGVTQRTRSFLAGQAIADYVEREIAVVDGIEAARRDVREGRTVPHDQAMGRLRDTIGRAASGE